MYSEMTVFGFTVDSLTQKPVVILKDAHEGNSVPIWISSMEAVSIAAELISRDVSSKSGREDLLTVLLKQTGMKVTKITIEGVTDGLFNAAVCFTRRGKELNVPVRPYEALIAALKYRLPIMVADDVVAQASVLALSDETLARENDARRFVDFLDSLDPEDLGKYPM